MALPGAAFRRSSATLGLQTETQALAGAAPTLLAVENARPAAAGGRRAEGAAGHHRQAARRDCRRARGSAVDRQAEVADRRDERQARCARSRGRRSPEARRAWRRDREGGPGRARRSSTTCCCRRREKAQADITMVSMTIGGDANQSMMTLLKLVSTQVPVSQGFADLIGLRQSRRQPDRPRARSRRTPRASRRWKRTSRR